MSIFKAKNNEELKQEMARLDEFLAEEDRLLEEDKKQARRKTIISWVTSGLMHATILLAFMAIIYSKHVEDELEAPPVHIGYIAPLPQTQEKQIKRTIDENKIEINIETPVETTKIADVVINPIVIPTTDEDSTENQANDSGKHRREEAVATSENGGQGAFNYIGAGGGDSGLMGSRTKAGKTQNKQYMGSHGKQADIAIDAGLRWLKKHQSPDGSWNAINYFRNCTDAGLKGEPGAGSVGNANIAITGYSLLCYLGVGYDHKTPNKYRKIVDSGISYLLRNQNPDGSFGERNYEHAIASMAIFEAFAMTNDTSLIEPSKKAIRILVDRQSISNSSSYKNALGWDYVAPNPNRIDFSVSGWCVMALKSAYAGGFDVKTSMHDFDKLLRISWETANPNWRNLTSYDKSIFPYTFNANTLKTEKDHLAFVGGLCSVFLGHKAGDPMLDSLTNEVKAHWLDTKDYRNNMYALYYSSLLAFQTQLTWKDWREEYVPYLTSTQIREPDTCNDGTWKFTPQQFHGADTSQVLLHTYALLALEVAYRFNIVGINTKTH